MQELARRGLPFGDGLSGLAGDADMKRDGHRNSWLFQFKTLLAGRCDEADVPGACPFPRRGTPRPPVQTRRAGRSPGLRSRIFSSDPRLPDLSVSGQLEVSPVTVAGAAAFEPERALSHS